MLTERSSIDYIWEFCSHAESDSRLIGRLMLAWLRLDARRNDTASLSPF